MSIEKSVASLKKVKTIDDVKALPLQVKSIALSGILILVLLLSTLFSGGHDFEGDYVLDLSKYSEKQARKLSRFPDKMNVFSLHGDEAIIAGDKLLLDVLSYEGDDYQIQMTKGEQTVGGTITLLEEGKIHIKGSEFGTRVSGWYLKPKP